MLLIPTPSIKSRVCSALRLLGSPSVLSTSALLTDTVEGPLMPTSAPWASAGLVFWHALHLPSFTSHTFPSLFHLSASLPGTGVPRDAPQACCSL